MGTASIPSILVRLAVTPEEWRAIQKLAIDREQRPSELMGNALRVNLLGHYSADDNSAGSVDHNRKV